MKNKVIMVSIIVLAILAIILLWQVISFKPSHNKSNAKDSEIDNSIFHEYYPQAEKLVNKMTLEEKVGQLFLVRYDSPKVDNEDNGAYIPSDFSPLIVPAFISKSPGKKLCTVFSNIIIPNLL